MSKYYIRVTDGEQDDVWYVGKLRSDGEWTRFAVPNFAKRYDSFELADEIAKKMRRRCSDRDGGAVLIEIIDASTGKPVTMSDYTPAAPPVKVPDKPGENWVPQATFTFGADKRVELQMCRTSEGMRYRYVDEYGIPASRSDSWVASADAFFSYARWKYYTTLIDFEAKKAQKN